VTYTLNNAGQLVIHYQTTNESKNLNSVTTIFQFSLQLRSRETL
jgi:hypothetical protein